jgi:hypothetical protein
MSTRPAEPDITARARAWRHSMHAAVCDVLEPWAHGTVARATRYESYWDLNVVRVEDDDPAMTVEELIAFSDDALAGLAHRRIDVEHIGAGERVRADFEARGWQALRSSPCATSSCRRPARGSRWSRCRTTRWTGCAPLAPRGLPRAGSDRVPRAGARGGDAS